jgi:putative addiction module component (TIGR02574 family)
MKAISELAKEALELAPVQHLVLARILLDLSDENQDISPEVEAAWEDEICRRMEGLKAARAQSSSFNDVFSRLNERFPA